MARMAGRLSWDFPWHAVDDDVVGTVDEGLAVGRGVHLHEAPRLGVVLVEPRAVGRRVEDGDTRVLPEQPHHELVVGRRSVRVDCG